MTQLFSTKFSSTILTKNSTPSTQILFHSVKLSSDSMTHKNYLSFNFHILTLVLDSLAPLQPTFAAIILTNFQVIPNLSEVT